MTLTFTLDEKDYLTHQLFSASKSQHVINRRRRNKIIVPLIYLVFATLIFFSANYTVSFIFLVVALGWFFLYPYWESKRYFKHYQQFINENHKNRFNKSVTIEINRDFIIAKDDGSEGKVLTTEVAVIHEIPAAIYIKLKSGQSFILPKERIPDIINLKEYLKRLASDLKIEYCLNNNWEWK